MGERPQNKNLEGHSFAEMDPEKARAIQSAGGKASGEARRKKRLMVDMLTVYSNMPITNKRTKKRLKNMGFSEEDDLNQKLLVADGLMKAAQAGNTFAIELYLKLMGEDGLAGTAKENNLLDAIRDSTGEDFDTDDLPEIQQTAASDTDMVEPSEV